MMILGQRAALAAFLLVFSSAILTPGVSRAQQPDQTPPAQQPATPDSSAPPAQEPATTEPAAAPAQTPPAQTTNQATPPQATNQATTTHVQPGQTATTKQSSQEANGGSKDRLFYAMPNFLTLENGANVPPLTPGQKFKLVTRSVFDPFQFGWYALLSGISQAQNSEPGYGQGWEGFGKRYASAFGDGTIEAYMVGAVGPTVFRQDPRYFQSGKGGFFHRTGYALSRLAITRGDNGKTQFNISEIGGSAAAAAISTYSYHPSEDKTLSNTVSVWGTQVAYDGIAIVVKEFWPDIRKKVNKKHQAPAATATPAP
jgi:hypothetical protein